MICVLDPLQNWILGTVWTKCFVPVLINYDRDKSLFVPGHPVIPIIITRFSFKLST